MPWSVCDLPFGPNLDGPTSSVNMFPHFKAVNFRRRKDDALFVRLLWCKPCDSVANFPKTTLYNLQLHGPMVLIVPTHLALFYLEQNINIDPCHVPWQLLRCAVDADARGICREEKIHLMNAIISMNNFPYILCHVWWHHSLTQVCSLYYRSHLSSPFVYARRCAHRYIQCCCVLCVDKHQSNDSGCFHIIELIVSWRERCHFHSINSLAICARLFALRMHACVYGYVNRLAYVSQKWKIKLLKNPLIDTRNTPDTIFRAGIRFLCSTVHCTV